MNGKAMVAALIIGSSAVGAQAPQPQKVGFIRYLQLSHAGVTHDLLAAAEQMPEANYIYKPSALPNTRTFAEVIAHASDAMFGICAALGGTDNPTPDAGKRVASKSEVVQTLQDAIALCTKTVDALDEGGGSTYIRQGPAETTKSAVLAGLLAHDAEMYGISTVYFRANNLVPPASRR